jgi:hypothetical protein
MMQMVKLKSLRRAERLLDKTPDMSNVDWAPGADTDTPNIYELPLSLLDNTS